MDDTLKDLLRKIAIYSAIFSLVAFGMSLPSLLYYEPKITKLEERITYLEKVNLKLKKDKDISIARLNNQYEIFIGLKDYILLDLKEIKVKFQKVLNQQIPLPNDKLSNNFENIISNLKKLITKNSNKKIEVDLNHIYEEAMQRYEDYRSIVNHPQLLSSNGPLLSQRLDNLVVQAEELISYIETENQFDLNSYNDYNPSNPTGKINLFSMNTSKKQKGWLVLNDPHSINNNSFLDYISGNVHIVETKGMNSTANDKILTSQYKSEKNAGYIQDKVIDKDKLNLTTTFINHSQSDYHNISKHDTALSQRKNDYSEIASIPQATETNHQKSSQKDNLSEKQMPEKQNQNLKDFKVLDVPNRNQKKSITI